MNPFVAPVLALGVFLATPALAKDAAIPVPADKAQPAATKCAVDPEIIVLPPCAVEIHRGRLRVVLQVVPRHAIAVDSFKFNRYGLAAACLPTTCWTYINRSGWVIVRDVAVLDHGASPFHHGLVRVTREGKWGLADTRGKLVAPLRYDGILDYAPGFGWAACSGCRAGRNQRGEHSWLEGGAWQRLNAKGKVIGPMPGPSAHDDQAEGHALPVDP